MLVILVWAAALSASHTRGDDPDEALAKALPPLSPALEEQRQQFVAAKDALAKSHRNEFERLLNELVNYPLLPYLQYADYSARLETLDPGQLASFLDLYSGAPLSTTLRQRWLEYLARGHRWREFVRFYREDSASVVLSCRYGQALYKVGDKDKAAALGIALWTAGESRPNDCDPLFELLIDDGRITDAVAWRRYTAAVFNHNYRLAKYVARFFSSDDYRRRAGRFLEVDQNPRLLASGGDFAADDHEEREIIRHGLTHLARIDPRQALDLWRQFRRDHNFSEDQEMDIVSSLVQGLYRAGHVEQADSYLLATQGSATEALLDWRLRELIRAADWHGIISWSDDLIPVHRDTSRWRYWRARALELTGSGDSAAIEALYRQLATERSFYGFLASEWLKIPYAMEHHPIEVSPGQITALASTPAFLRIRELLHQGEEYWARREWYSALADADETTWLTGAKLAQLWGWHNQAIMSMIRVGYWNDIDVRFPSPYKEAYLEQSDNTRIPVNLLLALTRQESAFNAEVISPAGARGLMQLMPATARDTARRHNIRYGNVSELFDPEKNILIGSKYYMEMLKRFKNNRILATAAYNAGPSRVDSWLQRSGGIVPFDAWIETIPFPETRNYVQNVLAFSIIYAHHLAMDVTILSDLEKSRRL